MATIVLIHGSMHGGWCWRDLVPELTARGHEVIAPDLPCEDAAATLSDYADLVDASLPPIPAGESLVLVGHSLGSRTIPVVAARRPGARMVFLCSASTELGPVDEVAFSGMVTDAYARAAFETRADGATRITRDDARPLFYHDCDDDTAQWAADRLRWQGPRPLREPSPLSAWPEGPIHMIVATEDRVARPEWLIDEAPRWLGDAEPILIPGGHSPMLSRPATLADALEACLRQ